jgi:ADP-ribosyl-[dinitrogen reductase] hydrolase
MCTQTDRIYGGLIGFAIADALAAPFEHNSKPGLTLNSEMEPNYLYNLPAGCWTFPTTQSLCVMTSLIDYASKSPNYSVTDFILKYREAVMHGYVSPQDRPLELKYFPKVTALKVSLMLKYKRTIPETINPFESSQQDAEPLFRLGPIVMKYYQKPQTCLDIISKFCLITHISKVCHDTCLFYAGLMIGALMGVKKDVLLSTQFNILDVSTYGNFPSDPSNLTLDYLQQCSDTIILPSFKSDPLNRLNYKSTYTDSFILQLCPEIQELRHNLGFRKYHRSDRDLPDLNIVKCVEMALWAFQITDNFADGCKQSVNLGLNSNGIGPIFGQLAGIYYGYKDLPNLWLSKLYRSDNLHDNIAKLTGFELN